MCTPDGYLYSREAILESLLQQKKANRRKLAAWEAQQQDELRKARSIALLRDCTGHFCVLYVGLL